MSFKIQNFPILFGQIFGFLIVILILILKGINGSGGDSATIYTSLFWIAQDMVIFAKFIRGGMYQLMIVFTILLSLILFYYSRKINDSITKNYIIFLGSIISNIFLCFSIIFLMLNEWFFFGALVTVPFFIGCGLIISSLMQNIFNERKNILLKFSNCIYFLIILILVLPNFSSVAGFLPEPPETKNNVFGNGGDYAVQKMKIKINPSDFIFENMTDWSKEYDWNVYIYVPDPIPENMPLAIYIHGYEGEEEWVYTDSLATIASRGVAVIFPQYTSNYDVSEYDPEMLIYSEGGSNHPQHEWRYSMAWDGVQLGIDYLENNFDSFDPSNLWVGGHSMGAGVSMYVITESISEGWGNNSFIINLEAPWVYSSYDPFRGNMSLLPEHTIVNVVEYEDDNVVERCIGVWEFNRIKTRDGFGDLNESRVKYLKIYSDRSGFPKLIASHYIQATTIRDVLADFSYYKRIDAQASYLFGIANNNLDLVNVSGKYFFQDSEELTSMGFWSNGVPVNEIEIYNDPFNIDLYQCNSDV